jgi:hypothetical protein
MIDFFLIPLSWLFSILPVATFPTGLVETILGIFDGIKIINRFLPLTHIIAAGVMLFGLEALITTFKIADEVVKKGRGSG